MSPARSSRSTSRDGRCWSTCRMSPSAPVSASGSPSCRTTGGSTSPSPATTTPRPTSGSLPVASRARCRRCSASRARVGPSERRQLMVDPREGREGVVLLDVPPGADGEFDQAALERIGHPVHTCHGRPLGTVCPLLDRRGCPLFARAHGIVFKLDLRRSHHRAILRRYQELARLDLPIRVVASPADAERYADLLSDVEV